MNYYSLKDLCSKSCKQIKMYTDHKDLRPQASDFAKEGEKFQNDFAERLGDRLFGVEMGNMYHLMENAICFSCDIITTEGNVVEVKSVRDESNYEDWYFNSCVLQCAAYCSFLKYNKSISTSSFYKKEHNVDLHMELPEDFKYFLVFGSRFFRVDVTDYMKIIDFFERKANACENWDTAGEFDKLYKRKEYEILSEYFNFTELIKK